jgi:hypothetical protein
MATAGVIIALAALGAAPASNITTGSALRTACEPAIRGLAPLLHAKAMIVVGEYHGTVETPAAVGQILCEAAREGLDVQLGVELSTAEQERIDAFLASADAAAALRPLLEGPEWHSPYPDGRTSIAVAELLGLARLLRQATGHLDVFAYDVPEADPAMHERNLAERIRARRREHPESLFVVLAGNVHARAARYFLGTEGIDPMGKLLDTPDEHVLTLRVSFRAGRAWDCELAAGRVECGPHGIAEGRAERMPVTLGFWISPSIVLRSDRSKDGYDGYLFLRALNESPPAVPPL